MDVKQLHDEFMSILSESHPGLTFEEYRDSCIFLLFYQYLCLKYKEVLEDAYKPEEMARLAVRGRLQITAFCHFVESASSFLHRADPHFQLTDFSFYKKIQAVPSLEKQKSFARFFRKLIKKICGWDCNALLLEHYPDFFTALVAGFSKMKKRTYLPAALPALYRMFFQESPSDKNRIFFPYFQYGALLETSFGNNGEIEIYGYEKSIEYLEIFTISCYMRGIPLKNMHLFLKGEWKKKKGYPDFFDRILLFLPEGAEAGELVTETQRLPSGEENFYVGAKGEFPFLLSAFYYLKENGSLAAIVPGGLLYREGKESQIRKYLIEERNCLDAVMLLPESMFHFTGQDEVFLFFKKGRKEQEVMFFDCSKIKEFDEEQMRMIREAYTEKKTIPGFCACVKKESIEENEYNLNLPRYIAQTMEEMTIDLELSRKRIEEIDRELQSIEEKMAVYRRELNLF